eukprot:jgi/Chlat1/2945/Chrsp2S08909
MSAVWRALSSRLFSAARSAGVHSGFGSAAHEGLVSSISCCSTSSSTWSSAAASAAASQQQRGMSGLVVEVRNDNFEGAAKRLKRLLKVEGVINQFKEHRYYIKPSERKRIMAKERDKRIRRRQFKASLRYILEQRERGY